MADPAAYMPALALAGAAVASQVLFVTTNGNGRRCGRSPRHRPVEALYFARVRRFRS